MSYGLGVVIVFVQAGKEGSDEGTGLAACGFPVFPLRKEWPSLKAPMECQT